MTFFAQAIFSLFLSHAIRAVLLHKVQTVNYKKYHGKRVCAAFKRLKQKYISITNFVLP